MDRTAFPQVLHPEIVLKDPGVSEPHISVPDPKPEKNSCQDPCTTVFFSSIFFMITFSAGGIFHAVAKEDRRSIIYLTRHLFLAFSDLDLELEDKKCGSLLERHDHHPNLRGQPLVFGDRGQAGLDRQRP